MFPPNNSTPFPTNFLTKATNKTDLNGHLIQKFLKLHDNDNRAIFITCNDIVISNDNNILTENLIAVCTSEEADS